MVLYSCSSVVSFLFCSWFIDVSMQLFSVALSLKTVPPQMSREKAAEHKSQFLSVLESEVLQFGTQGVS